jgi:formate--tetrahydrofolate ligase
LVATCRALKYNGGVPKANVGEANLEALKEGIVNLGVHIDNMRKYGVPVVVAINKFITDSEEELEFIRQYCYDKGADFATAEMFAKGGEGGKDLAEKVVKACDKESDFNTLYDLDLTIKEKVKKIANEIYRADDVIFTAQAEKALAKIVELGGNSLPVCIAKTQYSLSDNPALLGAPTGHTITVRDLKLSNGAGFVVVYTGDIMTMPGLPKVPAAERIDVDENGVISGLF